MSVTIGEDIIDSRDVVSRIEELRDELAGTPFANDSYDADTLTRIRDETPEEWQAAADNWDEDNIDELIALVSFVEQGSSAASDWKYGAIFIHDSHFQDYAIQLADEIGAVSWDARWPANCIDWKEAAAQLKADYTVVEVNGETYYTRA